MPRNVSGTYSLPLPPVVPNTTIESVWANSTLDDIAAAITDSLSRSGTGGMSAPFRLVDGTEAQPALAFNSQTGTGLWIDATSLNFSFQGASKFEIAAGDITGLARYLNVDGSPAAPAYSFTSDSDTGIARGSTAGNLNFITDGAMRAGIKNVPGLHVGDLAVEASSSSVGIYDRSRLVTALTTQYGYFGNVMFSTSATANATGLYVSNRFADGVYVTNIYQGLRLNTPTLGAGQTITSGRGLVIEDPGGVTSTYGILIEGPVTAGASRWVINSPGAARSYFEGAIGIGVDPPDTNPKLFVRKTAPAASPAWQSIDTAVFQGTTSCLVQCHAGATGGTLGFDFSVGAVRNVGAIHYTTSSNTMVLFASSTQVMTLTSTSIKPLVTFEPQAGMNVLGGVEITGQTHLVEGAATGLVANATADTLVLDSTGNIGLSFLTPLANTTSIMFGNNNSNNQGGFSYNNTSDILNIRAAAGTRVSVDSGGITVTSDCNATVSHSTAGTKVVGTRRTGWTAATGTATRTTFATASVTLPVLAEHVKALIDDLIAHGLIGA
jgi:hypothetical protein